MVTASQRHPAQAALPLPHTCAVPQVLCPVLVGRDEEMAELQAALQQARVSRGGVVVVSGEAGIGKSRICRELTERARSAGVRVATGRAVEGSSRYSFRPFGEIFLSLVREHGPPRDRDLEPFHAVLSPFVPAWAREEGRPAEPSLAMLEGIHRLLRALARDHGLLLVVEDVHWADADTLATLEFLADNVASERILCLCTERSGYQGEPSEVIARLVNRRAADRIALTPLGERDVETVARAALAVETVPGAVLGAIRRRAEGVPFLIEEMLSAYVAAGGRPEGGAEWWIAARVAGALPPSFRDLIAQRLESLDHGSRDVVKAAAILGRTFEWPLIGAILDRQDDEIVDWLRAAVSAQLLAGAGGTSAYAFSFRHALMREAVLAELLPPERVELSYRAAEAIEDKRPGLPGEWCERVAELREQAGDHTGACRLLQESARRALGRGALGSAEASLRRARALAAGDYTLWMGVDTLLCEVLAHAGKTRELASMTRALVTEWEGAMRHAPNLSLARMLPGPRRARIHLHAARAGVAAGDLDLARESLGNARTVASEDEATLVEVRALEAAVLLESGDAHGAAAQATSALADAQRLGLRESLYEAHQTLGRAWSASGDLDAAWSTFGSLREAATGGSSTVWQLRALVELGKLEALRRGQPTLLEEARERAVRSGSVSAVAAVDVELARQRIFLGRLDEARTYLDAALDAARSLALPSLADALFAQALLFALRGLVRDMESCIDEAVSLSDRMDSASMASAEAQAVLALVDEEASKALGILDKAMPLSRRFVRGIPWFLGLRTLLRAAAGESPAVDPEHSGNPVHDAYTWYARAIVEGRAGDADRAWEAFSRGDDLMPAGWRKHHARRIVAEHAIGQGWGEPAAWARDALAFFESIGAARLAGACKKLMRAAGVPAPRAGRGTAVVPEPLAARGVTSREMDVLVLVAQGLSNVEIAQRLFLSPRTVETHTKSLMRRTETTSRSQLVAFAGRHVPRAAAPEGG